MKTDKLFPYLIPIVLILLGAGGLALVWKVETRWISLPVGLISILIMIIGLMWMSGVADQQYNQQLEASKDQQEYHSFPDRRKQKIIYYTGGTINTILTMGLVISGSQVENFLNWKRFILELLIIGCVAGFITFRIYDKKFRIRFDDIKWDDHLRAGMFLLPLLVIFHASVWYNQLKPSPLLRTTKAVVTSEGHKYIRLRFDNEEQRFSFRYPFNSSVKAGDTVLFNVYRGALGYAFASQPVLLK